MDFKHWWQARPCLLPEWQSQHDARAALGRRRLLWLKIAFKDAAAGALPHAWRPCQLVAQAARSTAAECQVQQPTLSAVSHALRRGTSAHAAPNTVAVPACAPVQLPQLARIIIMSTSCHSNDAISAIGASALTPGQLQVEYYSTLVNASQSDSGVNTLKEAMAMAL